LDWSDTDLLHDIDQEFRKSLRLLGGASPVNSPNVFEVLRPMLRTLLCPRKAILEAPEAELVFAVTAVFLEAYTVHLAGSLAVYVCRKGIRTLCP
jgi:hypothetical protein